MQLIFEPLFKEVHLEDVEDIAYHKEPKQPRNGAHQFFEWGSRLNLVEYYTA